MSERLEPLTTALLLCRGIKVGPDKLVTDIHGLLREVVCPDVPHTIPLVGVFWKARRLQPGRHKFDVTITDAADNAIFTREPPSFEVEVSGVHDEVERTIKLGKPVFPKFGTYYVQIRQDGVLVASQPLRVVQSGVIRG